MHTGWRYDGLLCEAEDLDTGAMWECPLLIELNKKPETSSRWLKSTMRALSNISPFRDGHAAAATADAAPQINGSDPPQVLASPHSEPLCMHAEELPFTANLRIFFQYCKAVGIVISGKLENPRRIRNLP